MKFNTILLSLLGITLVGVGVSNLPTVAEARGAVIRGTYAVSRAVSSETEVPAAKPEETEAPAAKPEKVEGEFGTPAPNGGTYLSPGVGNPAGEVTSEIKPVNLPGETMIEVGVGNQPVVPEPAPQVEETPDEDSWVDLLDISDEEKAEALRRSKRVWLGLAEDIEAAAARAQSLQMAYAGDGAAAYNNGTLTQYNRAFAALGAVANARGAARFARKLHELKSSDDKPHPDFERTYKMYLAAAYGPDWGASADKNTRDFITDYVLLGPGHSIFHKIVDDSIKTIKICIE